MVNVATARVASNDAARYRARIMVKHCRTREHAAKRHRGCCRFVYQLDRVFRQLRHRSDQLALLQELGEADIAPVVEGAWAMGEAGQGVAPRTPVKLVVQFRVGLDEQLPRLVRMVDQVQRAALDRFKELRQPFIGDFFPVGDDDQFVIGRAPSSSG